VGLIKSLIVSTDLPTTTLRLGLQRLAPRRPGVVCTVYVIDKSTIYMFVALPSVTVHHPAVHSRHTRRGKYTTCGSAVERDVITMITWASCYALFDRREGVLGTNTWVSRVDDQKLEEPCTHSCTSIRTLGRLSTDAARRRW
jgi:hypothetical protein